MNFELNKPSTDSTFRVKHAFAALLKTKPLLSKKKKYNSKNYLIRTMVFLLLVDTFFVKKI